MRYMFMIYLDPSQYPAPDTPELLEEWDRYDAFTRETGKRQLFETVDALQPPDTGTTVRVRNDETVVSDGPFAETKEQLAGFYVLHCQDMDEALELWRRRSPARVMARSRCTPWSSTASLAIQTSSRLRALAAADERRACGDQRDLQGGERPRHRGTRSPPP